MSKVYEYGMAIGRFQPPHKGHENMLDKLVKQCDKPFIFVGSAQEKGTGRNPFSVHTRIILLSEIYGDDVTYVPIEDMTVERRDNNHAWGDYLAEKCVQYMGRMPDVMVYGNDDCRSGWFSPETIAGTDEIIVSRQKLKLSATYIRVLMLLDFKEEWKQVTHRMIHIYYTTLRNELLQIEFYKKLIPFAERLLSTSSTKQDVIKMLLLLIDYADTVEHKAKILANTPLFQGENSEALKITLLENYNVKNF